jgi:hypothetical protein
MSLDMGLEVHRQSHMSSLGRSNGSRETWPKAPTRCTGGSIAMDYGVDTRAPTAAVPQQIDTRDTNGTNVTTVTTRLPDYQITMAPPPFCPYCGILSKYKSTYARTWKRYHQDTRDWYWYCHRPRQSGLVLPPPPSSHQIFSLSSSIRHLLASILSFFWLLQIFNS